MHANFLKNGIFKKKIDQKFGIFDQKFQNPAKVGLYSAKIVHLEWPTASKSSLKHAMIVCLSTILISFALAKAFGTAKDQVNGCAKLAQDYPTALRGPFRVPG